MTSSFFSKSTKRRRHLKEVNDLLFLLNDNEGNIFGESSRQILNTQSNISQTRICEDQDDEGLT